MWLLDIRNARRKRIEDEEVERKVKKKKEREGISSKIFGDKTRRGDGSLLRETKRNLRVFDVQRSAVSAMRENVYVS